MSSVYPHLRAKLEGDHATLLAAGLAFNALVALIPLALLLGFALGAMADASPEADRAARAVLRRLWPAPADRRIEIVHSLRDDRGWIGVIGVVGLVWTSTRFVTSLRQVLDIVFAIPETSRLSWVAGKLHDLGTVVLGGLLLMTTMAVTVVVHRTPVPGWAAAFPSLGPLADAARVASYVLGFAVTIVMFYLLYRYVPNRKVVPRDAWLAAVFAGLLFEIAKIAVVLNVLRAPATLYGSFANLVAIALAMYLSSLIIVFGAELASARRGLVSEEEL